LGNNLESLDFDCDSDGIDVLSSGCQTSHSIVPSGFNLVILANIGSSSFEGHKADVDFLFLENGLPSFCLDVTNDLTSGEKS
jgi:hypothetical protein